jgi:RHS repeat-associated protein
MSLDIGFDAQTPSLPSGGGTISGLGGTFTPDLSTGGGSFAIPIDLPNGPGDIGPRLALSYQSGQGGGAFGLGFALPLPRLLRSVAHRFPRYDDTDVLLLEGAGELVRTGPGQYRPQVDGGAWRARGSGDGFDCLDRAGTAYTLGATPAGRLSGPQGQVYGWHLEQISDPLGNTASFTWTADGGQLYIATIAYGGYEVRFDYESRPDVLRSGRAGFLITTALRCHQVSLRMPAEVQPLLRSWTFGYTQHPTNNASLLSSVTLSGHAADGTGLSTPALSLSYSGLGEPTLSRFAADATAPPGLGTGPVDLVDWDGNGLPDVIALSPSGHARIWPNLGGCRWAAPHSVADVPALAGTRGVTLLDVDGDGVADLVPADVPLSRYVPRTQDGGFGRPVSLSRAPSPVPGSPAVRLVDLDGDGAVDLLASDGDELTLYYQAAAGPAAGWQPTPQVVGRGQAPVTDLADPHVFLADMTGDGLSDLVRVDGGGVTYWPYLGMGRWARPVRMADPPQLGTGLDPARLLLVDVDGDGVADLVQLDGETVRVWANRTGTGFAPPREIRAVPTGRMTEVKVADLRGTGAAGLVWCMSTRPGDASYFFLDLTGDTRPYLLTGIDNGIGLTTTVTYRTSAQEAARDAAAGRPWTTRLPIVLPVVTRVDATDATTGITSTQTFRYSQGRWDGPLREFAGYGTVVDTLLGDDVAPSLQTVSTFAIGTDPQTGSEPVTMTDRLRWRAIRGRLLEQARYGPDGTAAASLPYDITTQRWRIDQDGPAYLPRLLAQTKETYERQPTPASVITTTNVSFDNDGNVTESVQTAATPADTAQTTTLRTVTTYAVDPAGRFPAKPWRVTQTDGTGTVIADTVTAYDHLPEGQVGAQGVITGRTALSLTDAQIMAVHGGSPPDFATLGYHRRGTEDGWWVTLAAYQRTDDASGLSGSTTGPIGGVTSYRFDEHRCFPVSITDPMGNAVQVTHDYRVNRVARLTDASGAVFTAAFDALSRQTAIVEPGDTTALPTRAFDYDTTGIPVTMGGHHRTVSGQPGTIDSRSRFDGGGRLLEVRVRDETGEIISEAYRYGARGLPAAGYQPYRPSGPAYAPPDAARPHVSFGYDALGRPVRTANPDGSTRTTRYGPLLVEDSDEEDNHPGGTHTGTPTRRLLSPAGHVIAVQLSEDGRTITSGYQYNVKGELVAHVDALGNTVRFWYDCLGRTIRVDRPESSTRSVHDAAGNPVQARSSTATLVTRRFDLLNRPVTVHHGDGSANAVIGYAYDDAGSPPPPDATPNTKGGRLVRVDDEGGSTVLDYDPRGQVAKKTCTPKGSAVQYRLDSVYRADGNLASLTYPAATAGGARLVLNYAYDVRGQVTSVPGVVGTIEYDLNGRRTSVTYANGVVHTYGYDTLTDRLSGMGLTGPGGAIRQLEYRRDLVGNLVGVDSPDPALAAGYTFDDLYRLTAATQDGSSWTYGYADTGVLTSKSDVGTYHYGENGAAATCLTGAGTATFGYTDTGEMEITPWGRQTFDPLSRLIAIDEGANTATFAYDHAGARVLASSGGHTRITPDPMYGIEDGELILHLFDGIGVAGRRMPSGHTFYLHPDHLNSLAVVTDDGGAVVDALRYDPFGTVLARTGSGAPAPVGYTGGVPDQPSGLLYLNARWYAPEYGVFVSPDPVVQDALDPLCWAAYTYCRNNPVTFTDPTGRSFWGIFLAALAITALAVVTVLAVTLDVVSFGTLSAPLAIGVIALGLIVGGVVGGLAAHQKGGSATDILEGALVGAAVGGWAAFASIAGGVGIGGGVAGLLHTGGLWGAVTAGAVNGAISGAAVGFAAGYAGSKGSLDDVLGKVWQGAVVGLLAGAALGAAGYLLRPPAGSATDALRQGMKPSPGAAPATGGAPVNPITPPPSSIGSETQALQSVGQRLATKAGSALGGYAFQWAVTSPLEPAAWTLLTDSAAGAWDLYGTKILYAIGYQKGPQIKF